MAIVRARDDLGWVNIKLVTGTDFQIIDQNTFLSVNGDDGAAYTPANPIVVGGAGMTAACLWTLGSGALVQTLAASGKRLTLGDSDFFVLAGTHTGKARTLASRIAPVFFSYDQQRIVRPLITHDGGTLASVTFAFTASGAHAFLPTLLPRFRIFKLDSSGNLTPLKTTGSVLNGFLYLTPPASVVAYENAAAPQSFVYTCDAAQVIDKTHYLYFAEMVNEGGLNAICTGTILNEVTSSITGIPDTRFQ